MRNLIASILFASLSLLVVAPLHADESAKVFMFVREGSRDFDLMLEKEVGVMRHMLEQAGYTVDIATATGKAMSGDSMILMPTVALGDVVISDYVGVILPCMAPAEGFSVPAIVDVIVEQAVAAGIPIAAARGSVVTLARAGGLEGRRYSFPRDASDRPEFAGSIYEGVTVTGFEGMATSAICPLAARESGKRDGTAGLTRVFIESLPEAS
jgi:putative intracellular protease/amidase